MSDTYMISGMTAALGKAGLAEGTNIGTIKIAAPNGAGLDYVINGFAYHKADTDNIAITAFPAQPVLSTMAYLVQLDAAGNVSIKRSRNILNADIASQSVQWPAPDDNKCPIGGFKITTTNAATFTPGTTDITTTDVAVKYFDFALGMPKSPESALAPN